jgi:dUTP pyrophosphatase
MEYVHGSPCQESDQVNLEIKIFPGGTMPKYMTADAAGLDCYAAHSAIVPERGRILVELGFAVAIPRGYEGQIRPRSGMALKAGVMAAIGTIDSDYRGMVKALLVNTSDFQLKVEAGDRVCQLVISPVVRAYVVEVGDLTDTERGTRGFGHTGVK